MGVKKILIALTMLMALLIPANVFASEIGPHVDSAIEPYAAGWQLVGTETRTMNANTNYRTGGYYAVDGNNFKIELQGNRSSNSFAASIYVNGVYNGVSKAVGVSNGRGTMQFSGLKAGDLVYFDVLLLYKDTVKLSFYD